MALSSFLDRTKLKLAIDGALSTTDEPVPIYVLDELVRDMQAGDSRAGVEAVSARLAHRSPVVKQKALKLAAHIGRKGSPDLRRLMARHSGAVRDLLHYRCEPDPFKGDTVWKRVQEYAQEALNAIHGEAEAAQPAQAGLRGRIEGFGSGAGSGGGYGRSGGGGGGMLGFGSDSVGGGGGSSSSGGRMLGFGSADVVQSGMQALSSGMRSLSGRHDGYSASQLDGGYGGGGGYSGGSQAGGGALLQGGPIVQAPLPSAAAAAGEAGGGRAAPAAATGAPSSGGAEQRLVDRICTPAGLRAAPSRDDLRAFVDGISSLDGPTVARLLERKLDAGPWQATLRALSALEAVAEGGSSAACGQVAVHFQAHPEAVRRAAASPQASVRQRAQKVLALLGDAEAAAPAGQQQQQQQKQLFTEDLLGEAEPGNQSGPAGAASGTSAATLADLLGEPAPAAPAAGSGGAAPAAAAGDLLAGLDVQAPPAAAAQAAAAARPPADADLFGGMLLGAQPAAPAAAAQAPAAPSDLDLLGSLSLAGSAAAPTAAPTAAAPMALAAAQPAQGAFEDLLGGLSLGSAAAGPAPGAAMHPNGTGLAMQQQQQHAGIGMPLGGGWAVPGQQHPGSAAPQPLGMMHVGPASYEPAEGMAAATSLGAAPLHQPYTAQPQPLGGSGLLHGRQPSLGSGPLNHGAGPAAHGRSGSLSMLGSSGILDSSKDNSFSFVDDALAAARRKP